MRALSASSLMLAAAMLVAAPSHGQQRAAPLSARTIDGKPFELGQFRGQVVVVNFWATWCAPCRAEMPALDAYYRAHRDDGLAVLAVSIEQGVKLRKLQAATSGYVFAIARIDDTNLRRAAIPTAIPETRIYGRDGMLRYTATVVPLTAATLERIVTPLLAERGATPR